MVRINASSQYQDDSVAGSIVTGSIPMIGVLSWFNREKKTVISKLAADSSSSAVVVPNCMQMHASFQTNCLTWGRVELEAQLLSYAFMDGGGRFAFGIDGANTTLVEPVTGLHWSPNSSGAQIYVQVPLRAVKKLSEGWHTATIVGTANAAGYQNARLYVSASVASYSYITATVEG